MSFGCCRLRTVGLLSWCSLRQFADISRLGRGDVDATDQREEDRKKRGRGGGEGQTWVASRLI